MAGLTTLGRPLMTDSAPGPITPVPPLNTAVRLVPFRTGKLVALAVKLAITGAATTVTVALAVIVAPRGLVTVRVYMVVAPGLTAVGLSLLTAPTPLSILPLPLLKEKDRVAVPPAVMIKGAAVKLVITGAGTTVTVVFEVAVPPAPVTVRVYSVVALGVTLVAVPVVSAMFPGVTVPVPLAKTPVRWALPPEVTLPGAAVKLVMVGTGGGGVLPPPPQEVRKAGQAKMTPMKSPFARSAVLRITLGGYSEGVAHRPDWIQDHIETSLS